MAMRTIDKYNSELFQDEVVFLFVSVQRVLMCLTSHDRLTSGDDTSTCLLFNYSVCIIIY